MTLKSVLCCYIDSKADLEKLIISEETNCLANSTTAASPRTTSQSHEETEISMQDSGNGDTTNKSPADVNSSNSNKTSKKSNPPSKSQKQKKKESQIARIKAADTQAAVIFGHQETAKKCLKCEELSLNLKSKEEELRKVKHEAEESQEKVKDLLEAVKAKKRVIDDLLQNQVKRAKPSS